MKRSIPGPKTSSFSLSTAIDADKLVPHITLHGEKREAHLPDAHAKPDIGGHKPVKPKKATGHTPNMPYRGGARGS